MREGEPSPTAQRVAAYRLGYDRLPAPFGDPEADERLARDVAGSLSFDRHEAMGRYLRWRTAFFDRVVVGALERNVLQVATIGAGYDGRSLRYAKPGSGGSRSTIHHPARQATAAGAAVDRRDERHVRRPDLGDAALASALIDGGWEPDAPSVMLCEGLVVYLEARVLEALLDDLRAVATAGTRLAMSLSIQASGAEDLDRRRRFEEAVAALGEPARNWLDHESAIRILAGARWRSVKVSERSQRAGFVVAAPVWETAADGVPSTASRIGRSMERMYGRRGVDDADARVPDSQRPLYATLRAALSQAETCDGLPQALIHPDFVPANAIASRAAGTVLIDWTGAGRGPRLWSLAFLLWAAGCEGLRCVDAVVAAYRRHVEPTSAELERLKPRSPPAR